MKKKAHLVIPLEILEEVDKVAGKRKRSLFIADATREKLERERFLEALAETRGAWSDKDHPELKTAAGVTRFVREREKPTAKGIRGIDHGRVSLRYRCDHLASAWA